MMIITPLQIRGPNSFRDFRIIIVKQTLALPLPPDSATLLIASPPTVRILLLIGVTKICQRLLQLSGSPSSPCTECSYMITGIRRRGYAAGGGWPIYVTGTANERRDGTSEHLDRMWAILAW